MQLAVEQMEVGGFWEKKSKFSLKAWPPVGHLEV